MVYPLLPIYLVSVLGASPAILGFIEGIAESTASLLKVFSGYFSDKVKTRKPFTIFGYSSSVIGKAILYMSSSWGGVLFARLIDRVGKGVRTAPRDALIADSARANRRGAAFGLHRAMDTLGAAIGVLLAYFLIVRDPGEYKLIFLISLVPAVLGVLFLFFVKERKKVPRVESQKIRFNWSGLDKRLKLFLIFTFIFTLGNSSNQFLLLRARNMGNPLSVVLLLYLAYNLTYAAVSYPAAKLSDRIGRKKVLVLGYMFYGVVYLGFAMNQSLNSFWILFALYGLYMGFTEGVEKALISDIAPDNVRATTIGLHATLVGVGLLPASFLAGILWKFFGAPAAFYFGAAMGVTASIGLWFILKDL